MMLNMTIGVIATLAFSAGWGFALLFTIWVEKLP